MRSRIYLAVMFLVVLAVACGGGSSSSRPPPVPVVQSGSVDIDVGGGPQPVSFSTLEHVFDDPAAPGLTAVGLTDSTPAGWTVVFVWGGDINPGTVDTFTSDLVVVVNDPAGDNWTASNSTVAIMGLTVTTFATGPGGKTEGIFQGEVDWEVDPNLFLTLTGGTFTAERQ